MTAFDDRMCELFCGSNAFIYRKTSLKSDRQIWKRLGYALDHACVNKYEMFPCHDSLTKHHKSGCLQGSRFVPACMGFNYFNSTNAVDFPENIVAPAVDKDTLKKSMNTIVLANQLIIKCPHCQRLTRSFRFDDNSTDCYVKLGTEAHGWPAHFEYCENVGYVGECKESDQWLHLPSA
ncbi:hypothetical protein M3Y95_00887000 [Aphelenchoides besseyi]|nr:hypothetical protein M3Y95_00887000 [Aphelenchoides besseyi]